MALGLALAVLLARALGPHDFGIYSLAFAIVTLLAIPCQVGLPTVLVREVARLQLHNRYGVIRGLLLRANQIAIVFSLVAALIVGLFVFLAGMWLEDPELGTSLLWGCALIPIVALANLRGAALKGLRHVIVGQLPEMIIRPSLFFVLAMLFWAAGALSPTSAMALQLASSFLAFLVGLAILSRVLPPGVLQAKPEYETRKWLSSAGALAMLASIHIVNGHADVLILGLVATKEEVGIYRIAVLGSSIVAFGLHAVTAVVAPQFARLFADQRREELQSLVTRSARMIFGVALALGLPLVVFASYILVAVFGPEYERGALSLSILCVGQFVNAAAGSVGTLLNMSGHERKTLRGVAIGSVASLVLNATLIPLFGMEGAATASLITFLIWNAILWRVVRETLAIESTAFGPRLLPLRRPD